MNLTLLIASLLCSLLFVGHKTQVCSLVDSGDVGPQRLVIIKGKATIINFPGREEMPATSESLVFQKVGCPSCYVGANVDLQGNYQVKVGDGKYKIIVRNPSSPGVDWLAPDQERFIDTGSPNSSNPVFNFDIRIKMPT